LPISKHTVREDVLFLLLLQAKYHQEAFAAVYATLELMTDLVFIVNYP